MLLETLSQDFRKALSANSTDGSFPSRVATGTEPTGGGVFALSQPAGGLTQNGLVLAPYATAGDNDTFSVRLIGWRKVGNNPATLLWVPVVLIELACTCCAAVGVAGRVVAVTERFVDTIVLVTGEADVSVEIVSPGGDVIGHAVADLKGFQKYELTFDATAVGTTDMNCLAALI